MSRIAPEWPHERVASWLGTQSSLLVVTDEAYGHAAGLDVDLGATTELDPAALDNIQDLARLALATPVPPSATALATLLRTHPAAGAVALGPDGLLARAGAHPLVELRGRLGQWRCQACGHRPMGAEEACPACGGSPRPDVVLLDEVIDPRRRLEAEYLAVRATGVLVVVAGPVSTTQRHLLRSPLEEGAEVVRVGAAGLAETAVPPTAGWVPEDPDAALPAIVDAWLAS